ncbi:DUF6452 family protein [Reichenbachiella ulvae]|uniref:DUF6452 family protein n=1 Tax=Reichenbachiella ulvae TaxID=2980104 RepID=A0ABT3CVQ4_9BACT|nr:DUF6452 family protein [Reichenbachiella ulvae]MCV9387707.1 DUF6452 family protein [Reichenbachiella ulvae]
MKIKLRHIGLSLVASMWLFACANDPDCALEQPESIVKIVFYDNETEEKTEVKYDLIEASGSDSILYNRADTLALFNMPVNPSVDTLSYYFVTGVSIDSVTVTYQRKLDWLSEECGPYFKFSELKIVTHTFDSISVTDPIIDKEVNENIKIYIF